MNLANVLRGVKLISIHDVESNLSKSVQEWGSIINRVFTFQENLTNEVEISLGSVGNFTVIGKHNFTRDLGTELAVLQLQVLFDHLITN